MGDIFNGWRRKAAVVTLVMALVFTAGWVRSYSVPEFVLFWGYEVMSIKGGLFWEKDIVRGRVPIRRAWQVKLATDNSDGVLNFHNAYGSHFYNRFHGEFADPLHCDAYEWHGRLLGFAFGEYVLHLRMQDGSVDPFRQGCWRLPYWSVVLPLTLFSAYFLLSKPHSSTPKSTRERPSERNGDRSGRSRSFGRSAADGGTVESIRDSVVWPSSRRIDHQWKRQYWACPNTVRPSDCIGCEFHFPNLWLRRLSEGGGGAVANLRHWNRLKRAASRDSSCSGGN